MRVTNRCTKKAMPDEVNLVILLEEKMKCLQKEYGLFLLLIWKEFYSKLLKPNLLEMDAISNLMLNTAGS